MKRYKITLGDWAYNVTVLGDPCRAEVEVEVDGEVFSVFVEAMDVEPGATADELATGVTPLSAVPTVSSGSVVGVATTERQVVAPLPGVIKSISVRSGQQVDSNDELLVIEAMKMDNVIRAAREGIVGRIYVSEGHQIAYGDPLLEYVE